MGWDTLNLITSIGSFVFAIGVLLLFVNVWKSLRSGAAAEANPWDAPTLEWSVSSPPPPYNFAVIPTVASRHPLWEDRLDEADARSSIDRGMLLESGKETVGTSAMDADAGHDPRNARGYRRAVRADSRRGGTVRRTAAEDAVVAIAGAVLTALAILFWLWPRRELREREGSPWRRRTARPEKLPVGPIGRHGIGLWGVGTLVASEAALFSYLLFAYFYTGAAAPTGWLLEGHPSLKLALPNTILLLASSFVAWFGETRRAAAAALTGIARFRDRLADGRGLRDRAMVRVACETLPHRRPRATRRCTSSPRASTWRTSSSACSCWPALFIWTALDYFSPRRRLSVSAGVIYWHFVDVVWLFVFTTYYVTPYLGFGR